MNDTHELVIPTAVSEALGERHGQSVHQRAGEIRLADMYSSPFGHRVYPAAQLLMREVRTWLRPYLDPLGFGERIARTSNEVLSMCSYLFPDGDHEGTFLATALTTIEYVQDDIFDVLDVYEALRTAEGDVGGVARALRWIRENPRVLAQGMLGGVDILRDHDAPVPPLSVPGGLPVDLFLHDGLRDFSARLDRFGARNGSPSFGFWKSNFCDAVARFCLSHANIYRDIERLTIEEYAAHKFINSGMQHTTRLLELANGLFLSEQQHDLPLIGAVRSHCCAIGSLLNEITSYEKEVFGEQSGNLLLIVMLKKECDLDTATRYVAGLAQTHATELARVGVQAEREFGGDDPECRLLRRYVQCARMLAAACWYWQVEGTSRYKSPTSPFAELYDVKAPTLQQRKTL